MMAFRRHNGLADFNETSLSPSGGGQVSALDDLYIAALLFYDISYRNL